MREILDIVFDIKKSDFVGCPEGCWITVKGHRVFIAPSQTPKEAVKLFIEKKRLEAKELAKSQKQRILDKVKTLKPVPITADAVGKVGRPRLPGLKAGTPGAKISGAKRTKIGQKLKQKGITLGAQKGIKALGPDLFSVPFDIFNSETGTIVFGERLENTLTSEIQMTPVSSSNVKAGGQSGNSMYVQFLDAQGTYKYTFADPATATEATMSLLNSPSPGRWVWENLRGHKAGEPIPKTKIGPSIINKIPTIGGTTASLIQYELLGRTPVSRVSGFNKMSKLMERKTSNPTLDPNTGSRIEGLLGARKGFRELGHKIKQDFMHIRKRKILVGSEIMKGAYRGNIKDFTLQKVVA